MKPENPFYKQFNQNDNNKIANQIAHIGFWEWDIKKNLLNLSSEFKDIIGFPNNNINISFINLITKINNIESRKKIIRSFLHFKQTGLLNDLLIKFDKENGRYIWLNCMQPFIKERDSKGKPEVVVGIIQDITRLKEKELRESTVSQYYKTIINSLKSIVIIINKQKKIEYLNYEAKKLVKTNMSYKEIEGRFLVDIFSITKGYLDEMENVFRTKKSKIYRNEPVIIENKQRYLDISFLPLEFGGEDYLMSISDDVTHKKHAENIIIQTDKMISLGGLTTSLFNEINNPLAAIMQDFQVLKNRIGCTSQLDQDEADLNGIKKESLINYCKNREIFLILKSIDSSSERINRLVSNMLNFIRADENKSSIDIHKIILNSISICRTDFSLEKKYDFRQIKLETNFYKSDLVIIFPCGKLEHVFFNLVKNAAESIFKKKNSGNYPVDWVPQISIKSYLKPTYVKIKICDNGLGMDDEVKKRIFEPFFTTKKNIKGMGLGLFTTFFILNEFFKATIKVDSIPMKSTIFTIEIPLKEF